MNDDAREVPLLLLLELERERLRLCRDALQRSGSPRLARAWAAAVHDGERRVQQLAASCRELGADAAGAAPAAPVDAVHELAARIVAAMQQALAHDAHDAPRAKLAPSSTGAAPTSVGDADAWELRVG